MADNKKVFGLWFGGSSYAPGTFEEIEIFDTLGDAKIELWERWRTSEGAFRFVAKDGDMEIAKTPAVELEETAMWVWADLPEKGSDLYPDKILNLKKKEERPGEIGAIVTEEDA